MNEPTEQEAQLRQSCEEYLALVRSDKYNPHLRDEYEYLIFEAAMELVYSPNVWTEIEERDKEIYAEFVREGKEKRRGRFRSPPPSEQTLQEQLVQLRADCDAAIELLQSAAFSCDAVKRGYPIKSIEFEIRQAIQLLRDEWRDAERAKARWVSSITGIGK